MTVELALALLASCLYAIASLAAVQSLVRGSAAVGRAQTLVTWGGGLCLLAILIVRGLTLARVPAFGLFEALVWYGLAVTIAFLVLAASHETPGLSGILLPYVTLVVLCSLFGVRQDIPVDPDIQSIWLGLHVVTAFIGYGLFTLESLLAVAYLIQDRNLKHKRFGPVFRRLPSLEMLDHLMQEQIGLAFLVFSLSIGLGIFLAHRSGWGTLWTTDPKVATAAGTWLVYAILFHLRLTADRHGRQVAIVALAGLVSVLITFFGVHLVTGSMHDFVF